MRVAFSASASLKSPERMMVGTSSLIGSASRPPLTISSRVLDAFSEVTRLRDGSFTPHAPPWALRSATMQLRGVKRVAASRVPITAASVSGVPRSIDWNCGTVPLSVVSNSATLPLAFMYTSAAYGRASRSWRV